MSELSEREGPGRGPGVARRAAGVRLRYPTILILAPPFFSHLFPLMALGRALRDQGARVTVGCAPEFRDDIQQQGLRFVEVRINRNANRGVAAETDQADAERLRLTQFLEATFSGPIETLVTQARHRTDDMLANPEEIIETIRRLRSEEDPSLWFADQLSYGVTLALHGMDAPFMTFCAPHPATIPTPGRTHSVPTAWPSVFSPSPADLGRLEETAQQVERSFTHRFNDLLRRHFGKPPVPSAFGLTSSTAVIFNYPPFGRERSGVRPVGSAGAHADADPLSPAGARLIHAGHSYEAQTLSPEWQERVHRGSPRVLLALGTFLSSRADVLERVVRGIKELRPGASIFVGAGASAETLKTLQNEDIVVERFLPQRGLLPHVDLAVHHGGVSSFTETLHAGKPMIVMPFSSDQFSVARDVEDYRLGAVLDPNGFTTADLDRALAELHQNEVQQSVHHWSAIVRSRGPAYAAREIQGL